MKKEEKYRQQREELNEQDSFLRFKNPKWENKFQKWVYMKKSNLNHKFNLVAMFATLGVDVLFIINIIQGNDVFANIGNLCLYINAGSFHALDMIFSINPKLSRLQGILPSSLPYTFGIFRLFYYKSIYFPIDLLGIWPVSQTYFNNGCGFWFYRYLVHFFGWFFMNGSHLIYQVPEFIEAHIDPPQFMAYTMAVFAIFFTLAHYEEKARKDQFVKMWENKKQLKLIKEMNKIIKSEIKSKEQFFACMSHELRNPLNSLLGSIDLISGTKIVQMDVLNSAQLCGETLLNLIGNILDFSKVQAGKMEILLHPTDLREIVINSLTMFKSLAEKKGIFLRCQVDEGLPPALLLDSHKFSQSLINLIGNSIKFTEKGGIHINLEWYPIYGNISTDEVRNDMTEIFDYSSREDLKNLGDEWELMENESGISETLDKYDFNRTVQTFCDVENILTEDSIISPYAVGPSTGVEHKTRKRRIFSSNDVKVTYITKKPKLGANQSTGNSPIVNHHKRYKSFSRFIQSQCSSLSIIPEKYNQGIAKIEICDTGIGISKKHQNKLFQPFVQADRNTSKNFGGTGLGLWISRNIIKMMGGDIKIESELEAGSNFMIALPLVSADEKLVVKTNNQITWHLSKNYFQYKRCLYIEDQIPNQLIMKEILKHLGFEYVIANNGLEGFKKFKKKEFGYFDVIITDLRMRIMSGQEMIYKIREYENNHIRENEYHHVPIIVTSGDPGEREKSRCINILRANMFINKPIKFDELFSNLNLVILNSKLDGIEEEKKEEGKINILPEQTNIKNSALLTKRILIIEDDTFLNSILSQFLQSADYIVDQCYSKAGAIKRLEENGFAYYAAITIDSELKDGTGVETLILLESAFQKCTETTKTVNKSEIMPPIISISGNEIGVQKEIYNNFKITHFLQKPVSKQKLLDTFDLILLQ